MPATPHYDGPPDAPPVQGGRWVAVLLVLAAATMWSFSGIAVKWADADPIAFSALRGLGAALAMLPLVSLGARLTGLATPRPRLMLVTATLHTVMITSFICAMTYATAAEGIFLQYSAPAWAALAAWLLLGRRVDRATVVALAVAMAGIVLILALDRGDAPVAAGQLRWLGPALGVVAGISYGSVILSLDVLDLDARRRTGTTTNVVLVVLLSNVASSVVLIPWAIGRGMLEMPASMLLAIMLIGVGQMAAPYILFQIGLRRVGPVAAGLIALVEPIMNPTWVWLGHGEIPPRSIYLGGALILSAVVITALFGRRRSVATEPE